MIKIYSHPRSGTHFLEAFLAKNFYADLNLSIKPIKWGHWANRQILQDGNPYGKLFGSHLFPIQVRTKRPSIYIYRDGRAVAYSVWKTPNFLHPELEGISFSEFLRTKIDWEGSPSNKVQPRFTIAEHWYNHVEAWNRTNEKNLLIVRYEDLKMHPHMVYDKVAKYLNPIKYPLFKILRPSHKVSPIDKPIGLLPNKAKVNAWEEVFNHKDLEFFYSILPSKEYLYFPMDNEVH